MPGTLYDALQPPTSGSETPTIPTLSTPSCAHVSNAGIRCPRDAAPQETVCILHGASIPHATEAMTRRLLALREKSIAMLEELMLTSEDKIRLTACIAVLDRAGLGPRQSIEVTSRVDLSALSLDDLTSELTTLTQLARDEQSRRRVTLADATLATRMNEAAPVKSSRARTNTKPH